MKNYEYINTSKNILMSKLFEPEENSLEFELAIGELSDINDNIREIVFNNKYNHFKVFFETYIGYSVINESYENLDGGSYTGEKIRIYSSSNFLSYLKKETFATSDYPGEFKHYAFITSRHIINIVSQNAPKIEKVEYEG